MTRLCTLPTYPRYLMGGLGVIAEEHSLRQWWSAPAVLVMGTDWPCSGITPSRSHSCHGSIGMG